MLKAFITAVAAVFLLDCSLWLQFEPSDRVDSGSDAHVDGGDDARPDGARDADLSVDADGDTVPSCTIDLRHRLTSPHSWEIREELSLEVADIDGDRDLEAVVAVGGADLGPPDDDVVEVYGVDGSALVYEQSVQLDTAGGGEYTLRSATVGDFDEISDLDVVLFGDTGESGFILSMNYRDGVWDFDSDSLFLQWHPLKGGFLLDLDGSVPSDMVALGSGWDFDGQLGYWLRNGSRSWSPTPFYFPPSESPLVELIHVWPIEIDDDAALEMLALSADVDSEGLNLWLLERSAYQMVELDSGFLDSTISDGDVMDLEGEGSQVIILAARDDGTLIVDPSAGLSEAPVVVDAQQSIAVAVGDLDGDGDSDVVFHNGVSIVALCHEVEDDESHRFVRAGEVTSAGESMNQPLLEIADLDGDGRGEVIEARMGIHTYGSESQ